MTKALILCDRINYSMPSQDDEIDRTLFINTYGDNANLSLHLDNLIYPTLRELSARAEDLLRIASYVYAADRRISRGKRTDVFGKNWERDLDFHIPVKDVGYWEADETKALLVDALQFLSGDRFSFAFHEESDVGNRQLIMDIGNGSNSYGAADSVFLFSGGADSLCAVVEHIAEKERKPLLVSHRSSPLKDNLQSELAELLRNHFTNWSFPQLSLWLHLQNVRSKEHTQRTRSFLFTSLGLVVAAQVGLTKVFVPDNGVVSINPSMTGEVVGTFASRSTHPKFLYRMQKLARQTFDPSFMVVNPLEMKTRAEALEVLVAAGCPEFLQETVSCWQSSRMPEMTPHCGVCSQCVDRRLASIAADMEAYDMPRRYEIDIFADPIPDGHEKSQVLSYVRFANRIHRTSDEGLFGEFPELVDGIIPEVDDPGEKAKSYSELFRRYSAEVRSAIQKKLNENQDAVLAGTLVPGSLLNLIGSAHHARDPVERFARRILTLIESGLPRAFSSRQPENESEVQAAIDSFLASSEEVLSRELPLLPFAGISTKPDFSQPRDPGHQYFYIEVKYVGNRARLNGIVTEITSRGPTYEKQGAFTLFPVYDPFRHISDDDEFIHDVTVSDRMMVAVIR